MTHSFFKLGEDGKTPVAIENLYKVDWKKDQSVKKDKITTSHGDVSVSTIFLSMDHNFTEEGSPLLFETMILGGKYNGYQERYSTWDEAIKGHQIALDLVLNKLTLENF